MTIEPDLQELLVWSTSQMKWARDVAEAHETKIPPVKGIRKLNTHVQTILRVCRNQSPARRAQRAAALITHNVCKSYGVNP